MTTKTCTTCLVEKDISNFKVEKRPRYTGEYENTCRDCKNKTNERYRNTYQGFLKGLLKHARSNSKSRKAKGRDEAGEFELTYEDILEIIKDQDGRCYYSNVPLSFKNKSDYRASIERLDPSKGYIKSNVVVCCLEFNDAKQWSKEKVKEMYDILQITHDYADTDFSLKKKIPNQFVKAEYDTKLYHQCNKCFEVKPLNQFNKNKGIGCKDCIKILDQERMKDPRNSILALLKSARSNTKQRKQKGTAKDRDFTLDITFDDLVNIYRNQKGLCAYSGLPLKFGNSNEINWKISLERINPKQGYTRDNVCLIVYELNTGDKRILYNDDSSGSCAWSKEKFNYICQHITNYYRNESIETLMSNLQVG